MTDISESGRVRNRCVVIVTFNSAADIVHCLESIPDEKVIVVDNASSDDTTAIADSFSSRLRVIRNRANRGFSAAANQGIRAAMDTDIVLVNPDVLVNSSTLDQLADTAYRAGAGLVVPRLTYPDGASQESARTFPTLYHLLGRRTVLSRTSIGHRWHSSSVPSISTSGIWAIDWAIGALMYVPRTSIDITGGFDERFFLYGEDVDFCGRMWRSGLPVLLDTHATATHRYGRDSKRTFDFRRSATRYHWVSMCRLGCKYPAQFFFNRPMVKGIARTSTVSHLISYGVANGVSVEPARVNVFGVGRSRPHLRGEVPLPRLAIERGLQMFRLYENWPTAIADRLRFVRRRRHVLYRVRSGGGTVELVARANGCDIRTIGEIWVGGLYDRLLDSRLLRSRPPVVVDIGANCGYFAIYMAKRYPGARLICFEPEAENRSLARINLEINGVRARLHAQAVVVDHSSTVVLNLSQDPRLHTTVSFERAEQQGIDSERYSGRSVAVPAVNINDAIAVIAKDARIDLLKVDVEGIDLDLVGAIDEQLVSQIDCMVAETEHRDTEAVALRLRAAGFRVAEDAGLLFAFRTPQSGAAPGQGDSPLE